WKEDTNDTTTYRTNHTQEEILDGVFREEMQQSTVTEAEKAKARMEDAVYKGSLHTEERTANHAAAAKKPKKNGFAVIVATGLICSIVGGSIGGVVGANIAQSKYEEMNYTQSDTDRDTAIQLVGNQSEISPVIAIAKKVMPSVVGVHTYGTYSYWGRQITNMELGSGSGVIYSEDGYIITNYHVIEDATSVVVTLSDEQEYEAVIIGADEASDLAVLKIDAGRKLPAAEFGNSSELQIGELVVAIGNPLGYDNTVTDGIVSGLNRQLSDYTDEMTLIQTNAAINSGNSGGALVNGRGEVIGINSAKLVASNAEGMGFALSIDEVKPLVEQLITQGHVSRPYMGVTIDSQYQVDEETAERYEIPMGIMIYEVAENSPAERAGLRAGDIIYKVNDTLIQSFDDLSELIDSSQVGDTLRVLANREGKKVVCDVVLGDGGK
ncbi:MAG: trypsin-like peptidase domain-containing protein, partial [Peptococcaceae bacterium]|nr:trypsin-like peptidase domain-containing protein [Peptococcaceae bacterium]